VSGCVIEKWAAEARLTKGLFAKVLVSNEMSVVQKVHIRAFEGDCIAIDAGFFAFASFAFFTDDNSVTDNRWYEH
jgi:hypothetical protein